MMDENRLGDQHKCRCARERGPVPKPPHKQMLHSKSDTTLYDIHVWEN